MIPTCCPRQRASSFSLFARSSLPAKSTRPLSGRSIPVSMLSRVDFPLPDGPLIVKRLPAGTRKVTSSKIVVLRARVVITRERCSTWIRSSTDGCLLSPNSVCGCISNILSFLIAWRRPTVHTFSVCLSQVYREEADSTAIAGRFLTQTFDSHERGLWYKEGVEKED